MSQNVLLNIDNKFITIYPHVHGDEKYKEPIVINGYSTYCSNPEEFIKNEYYRRLSRMNSIDKDDFVFVLCINKNNPSDEENEYTLKIVELLKKRNNKSIVISPLIDTSVKDNILFISDFVENLDELSVIVKNKIEEYNFL